MSSVFAKTAYRLTPALPTVMAAVSIALFSSAPAEEGGEGARFSFDCPHCLDSPQGAALNQSLLGPLTASATAAGASVQELNRYPFYPSGGVFGKDIAVLNYFDVVSTGGIGDAFCGQNTYNGHKGIDSDVLSWDQQLAGVPVFAVLDGTVAETHDGEPDMNVIASGQDSNLVRIDHGDGHQTLYLHLKKNSVSVSVNDTVRAGQQIGMIGSSGNSSWPHLHFASYYNNSPLDPLAGPCRAGQSLFIDQPENVVVPYIRDFSLTTENLSGWGGPPDIPSTRGTWVQGSRTIYLWYNLISMTPNMTRQVRVRRPNDSIAYTGSISNFSGTYDWYWGWQYFTYNYNQTGEWTLEFLLNGQVAVQAPIKIVSNSSQIQNRAPYPAAFTFNGPVGPDEVPVCSISDFTPIDDPDYDLVLYRYHWKINGITQRDVTTAVKSDAFPRGIAVPGDVLTCEVTPSDGSDSAATSTVTTTIFQSFKAWAIANGLPVDSFHDDLESNSLTAGMEYLLGISPGATPHDLPIERNPSTGALSWDLPLNPLRDPSIPVTVMTSIDLSIWATADTDGNDLWWAGSSSDRCRFFKLDVSYTPVVDTVPVTDL
jgi:hypothetical protein